MYNNIIINTLEYTRPLLIGKLYYTDKYVSNEIGSLIVLNKHGDILTTASNANVFLMSNAYTETYPKILKEINESKNKKKTEKKYGIEKDSIVGMSNTLIDISKNPGKLTIKKHKYLNLAIIRLENNTDLLVNKFPKLSKNKLVVGSKLITLGFAFPEYLSFKYDEDNYKIKQTNEFMSFPIFPSDGIMCRNIIDNSNKLSMLECTNIISDGMEGGPIINEKGLLSGMIIGSRIVNDKAGQIRLGVGINIDEIKSFLDENDIEYEVEDEK